MELESDGRQWNWSQVHRKKSIGGTYHLDDIVFKNKDGFHRKLDTGEKEAYNTYLDLGIPIYQPEKFLQPHLFLKSEKVNIFWKC